MQIDGQENQPDDLMQIDGQENQPDYAPVDEQEMEEVLNYEADPGEGKNYNEGLPSL